MEVVPDPSEPAKPSEVSTQPGEEQGDATLEASSAKVITKSQARKLVRREKAESFRLAKRLKEREAKRAKLAEPGAQEAAARPPIEKLPFEDEIHEYQTRAQRKDVLNACFARSADRAPTVVLDLTFDHLMFDSELKSLASQCGYVYNSNRYAAQPFKVELRGSSPTKSLVGSTLHKGGVLEAWRTGGVTFVEESLDDLLKRDPSEAQNIVYLSADSENELTTLDPTKKYVIGGIVDRNRHKLVTATKAAALGVATARFPITKEQAAGFSQVLTTNHTMDVLLEFACALDWNQACVVGIPARRTKPTRKERIQRAKALKMGASAGGGEQEEEEEEEEEKEDEEEDAGEERADALLSSLTVESAARLPTVVMWPGPKSLGLATRLFRAGWDVVLVHPNSDRLSTFIRTVRAEAAPQEDATPSAAPMGRVAGITADCRELGDCLRVRNAIERRFHNRVDGLVLESDEEDSEVSSFRRNVKIMREIGNLWSRHARNHQPWCLLSSRDGSDEARTWREALGASSRVKGLTDFTAGDELDALTNVLLASLSEDVAKQA